MKPVKCVRCRGAIHDIQMEWDFEGMQMLAVLACPKCRYKVLRAVAPPRRKVQRSEETRETK